MNFVFVSTMADSPWGGSEELWSQAALQLKKAGHGVSASVAYRPILSQKVLALARQGIRIRPYPSASYVAGSLRHSLDRISLAWRRTFAWLLRCRPDLVVISQGHNSGGFHWARICREAAIPYVIIVQCNSDNWWFDNNTVEEAAASYTAARNVFCVSQSNLDLLRIQVGEPLDSAEVVWNPYNVTVDQIPAWPPTNGRWNLACVARMDPAAKGQGLLLEVLARSEWRDRPVELNFFGEGLFELPLRRLVSMLQLKNVHFRGHVSDINAIWEEHHMLVLPSRYEGLPLALVEAMWCGRPAVVTDVAGNAEVCVDNETGFVAPAATVPLLADTLERAWNRRMDWQRMGQAARVRAENQIPRDPAAVFAERLKSCANPVRQAPTSAKLS
jgi:glycosyltransferase involved in cell wall biosynthesis